MKSDYMEVEDEIKIKVRGHEFNYKVKKDTIKKRSSSVKVYDVEIIFILDHTVWE